MQTLVLFGTGFGSFDSDVAVTVVFEDATTADAPVSQGSLNNAGTTLVCTLPFSQACTTGFSTTSERNNCNAGVHSIFLTRFGTLVSNSLGITYVADPFLPSLQSISPTGGLVDGGTDVTITGAGFGSILADVTVTIATQSCTVTSVSMTSIVCTTSATAPGVSIVQVSRSGNSATNLLTFEFVNNPLVTSLSPLYASQQIGSVNVTLSGAYFGFVPADINVSVVTTTVRASVSTTDYHHICQLLDSGLASNQIRCTLTPPSMALTDPNTITSAVSVITVFRYGVPASTRTLTWLQQPEITSLFPRGGVLASVVTIFGSFGSASVGEDDIKIFFAGDQPCAIIPGSFDGNSIQCFTPSNIASNPAVVTVEVFGLTSPTSSASEYFYVDVPAVFDIGPALASLGDLLTISGQDFGSGDISEVDVAFFDGRNNRVDDLACDVMQVAVDAENLIICKLVAVESDVTSRRRRSGGIPTNAYLRTVVSVVDVEGELSGDEFLFYKEAAYVSIDSPAATALIAILAVIFIINIFTAFVYIIYRRTKILRSQSPLFCGFILLGLMVTITTIFPFLDIPTTARCNARIFLPFLGFFLIFVPLTLKIWRIDAIFSNTQMKQLAITDAVLLFRLMAFIGCGLALLFLNLILYPLTATIKISKEDKAYYACELESNYIVTILLVLCVLVIVYAILLAFRSRNVTSEYNESKQLGFAVYNVAAVCLLIVPVAISLKDNPLSMFIIISIGIIIVTFFTWAVLFPVRMHLLFSSQRNHSSTSATQAAPASSTTFVEDFGSSSGRTKGGSTMQLNTMSGVDLTSI
jgi:hypothetical protein